MKIKISRKVLLIVAIAVFTIILGMLARTYFQQLEEQNALETSLSSQQTLLHRLTTDKQGWEDKRQQAESLLDKSTAEFPPSVECIEYGEDLFAIATDCNLDLTNLSMSTPGAKRVGTVTYSAASFTVKVTGDMDAILDFIYALRTGDGFQLPWSADISKVIINIGDGVAEAGITLEIYAYER
jgi:hypothetical protein